VATSIYLLGSEVNYNSHFFEKGGKGVKKMMNKKYFFACYLRSVSPEKSGTEDT
jgi:hypothetical protein